MTSSRVPTAFAALAIAGLALGNGCGLDLMGLDVATDAGDAAAVGPDAQTGSSGGHDASGTSSGGDSAAVDDASVDADASAAGDASAADDASPDAHAGSDAGSATDAPVSVAPPEFAWYKLDETSGDLAHDSTANHYDVHLQHVVWNTGANFSLPPGGSPGGGKVNVAAGLRQAPVSFTAWLAPGERSDRTSNDYSITPFPPNAVSGDSPGAYGFGIGLDVWTDGTPGSALSVENVGYTYSNAGGAPFAAGTEYFVAATIGTGGASIYVDGQEVATGSPTPPGPAANTTLALGLHNDDTGYGSKRFYVGRMRDVRVYKRVLTASEVAALYADGPAP